MYTPVENLINVKKENRISETERLIEQQED